MDEPAMGQHNKK